MAIDSNTLDYNEQLEEETDERIDAGIIYTIPKRYKEKAKQLMQRLRACGKVVWDANSAVTIDPTLVPGTQHCRLGQ